MKDLVDVVTAAWGWTGVVPMAVTKTSPFGHLIIRDAEGVYWYLDPELGTLERIATDDGALALHMADAEVQNIWHAASLVKLARETIGIAEPGRCYALKTPAMLGGGYEPANLCTLPLDELIGFTGDLARQIGNLPEGAQVKVKVVD